MGGRNGMLLGTLAALLLGSVISAGAQTFNVKAGKATPLFPLGQFENDTCMVLPPPRYDLAQPENGRFKVITAPVTLTRGICKGKSYNDLWLVYTPERGFKGRDRGSIRIERMRHADQPAPSMHRYNLTINVE